MASERIASWAVFLSLACICAVFCGSPVGSIDVLMLGQVFPYETPVAGWLEDDPAFDYVVVPVRRDTGGWSNYPEREAKRYVRLYFPRTYELLAEYDFLCYVDTYFGHLTGTQIDCMYRSVRDSGLGGLTTLGGGISWVQDFRQSWVSSSVGSAFPTDYVQAYDNIQYVLDFRISVPRSPGIPEVFKPFLTLGIENQLGRQAAQLKAKEGSTTFATMTAMGGAGMPFAVAWKYGKGITWSVATDIQTNYNLWWTRWEAGEGYMYAMDLFLNMVLYATGREPIQDVFEFHRVREMFGSYRERKAMLYSLLDFVETFGASRGTIDRDVEDVDVTVAEARGLYLDQDVVGAAEAMTRAFDQLASVSDKAICLKNRALLWVYIVEWTVVTATLMMSGFALWTVMVRRRLYRATGTTRLL